MSDSTKPFDPSGPGKQPGKLTIPLLVLLAVCLFGRPAEAKYGSGTQSEEMLDRSSLHMVGQVGGRTEDVAVQGDYAYVGVGLRLVVLDVSQPTTPTQIGSTTPFPQFVAGVTVSGTLACVADGMAGLRVVDVSNPSAPVEIGVYDTPGYAEGVAVAGQYAYVADGHYGLRIVDVSDPAHPTEVAYAYPLNYVFDVAVDGQYVYLAAAGAGLLVVDVSQPTDPEELRAYDTPGYAYGVDAAGDVVYVADGWEGLRVVNVSNPEKPVEVGSCDTPGWAFGVDVVGSRAYVADAFGGLRVLDVSDPTHPAGLGGYEVSGGHAGSVVVAGDTAYVADHNWGLRAVDVSDPANPAQVGFYGPLGYARDVAVAGNYAYVAAATYGLRVVDISDPACPVEVGVYDTQSYAINVAVSSNYAYVACFIGQMTGLHVVDISSPAHPTRVGYIYSGALDMAVAEGMAYMADEWGLRLISVADPMHPTLLGGIELQEEPSGCTVGVAVRGNLAYVCVQHAGLKIVDVSDPSDPKLIGVTPHLGQDYAQEVAVAGDYAYVTTGRGLRVVDVSDPTDPAIVGSYDTPGAAAGIVVSADTAYVADDGGGLQVVDVSDPSNLVLAGSYNTPGYAHKVTVVGKHVYVADGDGGMLILEMIGGQTETVGRAWGEPAPPVAAPGDGMPDWPPVSRFGRRTSPIYHDKHRPDPVGRQLPQPQPHVQLTAGPPRISNTCVVTSAADSGPGSLRWCLQNAVSGDTITFDPDVFPPTNPVAIALASELPWFARGNITIDASNAGVILDGSGLAEGSGLTIDSNGNVIKGLQILHFPADGVVIRVGKNVIGGDRSRGSGPMGEGNLISGNGRNDPGGGLGVNMETNSATGNIIIGNFIGTDASGMNALGNRYEGIRVCSSYNRIGGTDPGERNIISGNGGIGVSLNGDDCTGNTIIGNYIGTDASGTADLGNTGIGVVIWVGAFNNLVERNLVSGNSGAGVIICDWGSSYNTVIGNLIGTDVSGTFAIGNGCGVGIGGGTSFNRIGGAIAEERNVISGNGSGISGGGAGYGNLVMGNFIGTDISGTSAVGNAGDGVDFSGTRVFIGGMTEGERNVISGNRGFAGIHLSGSGTDYNWVAGNYIGTDASGMMPIGNSGDGISIDNGANNYIGPRNIIANNGGDGVGVHKSATGNTISRNSIYGNSHAGISLADGGNNLLAAPVITDVLPSSVSGIACPGCIVEIFSDEEDEGQVYEGSVTAGGQGNWTWIGSPSGPYVTATATDGTGNTSPFSSRQMTLAENRLEER